MELFSIRIQRTFQLVSTSLKGESPYTVVEGKKVHLYERELYPELFEEPGLHFGVFEYCTGLTDYANMPSVWQKFQD